MDGGFSTELIKRVEKEWEGIMLDLAYFYLQCFENQPTNQAHNHENWDERTKPIAVVNIREEDLGLRTTISGAGG